MCFACFFEVETPKPPTQLHAGRLLSNAGCRQFDGGPRLLNAGTSAHCRAVSRQLNARRRLFDVHTILRSHAHFSGPHAVLACPLVSLRPCTVWSSFFLCVHFPSTLSRAVCSLFAPDSPFMSYFPPCLLFRDGHFETTFLTATATSLTSRLHRRA